MKKLIELLKKEKLYGWKIITIKKHRANLHYTKNYEEETYLEGKRKDVEVTIYVDYGKEIGENTFPITSDDENIKELIKDAVYACSFTKKQKYQLLAKKEKGKNVQLVDKQIKYAVEKGNGRELLQNTAKQVFKEFRKEKQVKLNGMELIASIVEIDILTSKNIHINSQRTDFYIDAVITSFKKNQEQEFLGIKILSRIKDFDAALFVKRYCQYSRDILVAQNPKSFEGSVILKEDAINDFFVPSPPPNPLAFHSNARIKYMKISKYKIGDYVTQNPPKGDFLTIVSNPYVSYNPASLEYDFDAVASKKVTIIEKSKVKNFYGDLRHSQYIGIKPTGMLGVIEVSPGKIPQKALEKQDHYEIVAFSWFNPDELSGNFSAEIRLGYIVKNNKKIPFKGGTFTGNIFKLFENVNLSKEIEVVRGYKGPKAILFKDATVSGE